MKKLNRIIMPLLFVYLGIMLVILPNLLRYEFSTYAMFDILSSFGWVLIIIGFIQTIYQKFQNRILSMFDYGHKMNEKGISQIGVIDDKDFDFCREVLNNTNEINIMLNTSFHNNYIEMLLISILNEKDKKIKVLFTDDDSKYSINDDNNILNHYIKKSKRNEIDYRFCNIHFSNIFLFFDGKICILYNNDIDDGSVFYTVINSISPNYQNYKDIFAENWDKAKDINC